MSFENIGPTIMISLSAILHYRTKGDREASVDRFTEGLVEREQDGSQKLPVGTDTIVSSETDACSRLIRNILLLEKNGIGSF